MSYFTVAIGRDFNPRLVTGQKDASTVGMKTPITRCLRLPSVQRYDTVCIEPIRSTSNAPHLYSEDGWFMSLPSH
jgi:hypothetical protein